MGWFEKLISLPQLQPFFRLEDDAFVEDRGWQEVLRKVKQLQDRDFVLQVIKESEVKQEKEKIILGYLCTIVVERAEETVELPCVDYAGCYLTRGILALKSRSSGLQPNYVGLGMDVSTTDTLITIDGNVGDFLGYRARRANIVLKGNARERAGMAIGDGSILIEGDVSGGLGGNTQSTRLEVIGSVGSIERDNVGCTILVGQDVNWGIGENQQDCFIRVSGSVGVKAQRSGRVLNIAEGLARNSMLLVGEDIYGNIGKKMEVARIFVWGRVHGEIRSADSEGGFIYLQKKRTPLLQRMKGSIGGNIGVKYVSLKESGYLFAEGPDDIQGIVVKG